LSRGMKQICQKLGLNGITLTWARHTFGTVARNKARFSKDDVALALNHVETGRKTTDIYIEKDSSIVDELQYQVLINCKLLAAKKAAKRLTVNAKSIFGGIQLMPIGA